MNYNSRKIKNNPTSLIGDSNNYNCCYQMVPQVIWWLNSTENFSLLIFKDLDKAWYTTSFYITANSFNANNIKNIILFKVSFLLSFWVYEYSYYIHYQSKDCQYKEAQRKVFVFLILRLETTVILSSWSMFILGANNLVYRSKYNNCFIRRANSRGNLKPYDSLTLTWNRRNLNTLNQEFNAYANNQLCQVPYFPNHTHQ